jgi:hypothetical protein
MKNEFLQILALVIFPTLIVVALVIDARTPRVRKPVTFKNLDEEQAVFGVADWASKQLGMRPGDPQLLHSFLLDAYLNQGNWMGRIPTEELALLSPFIDLMIEGKGPPQNLPAEYDDPRPEILRRFKGRMQAEGLWPPAVQNKDEGAT